MRGGSLIVYLIGHTKGVPAKDGWMQAKED